MTFKFTTQLQWFKLGETFIGSTLWMEWYYANDLVDDPAIEFPKFLSLSKKQELEYVGIAACMDMLLCDEAEQVKHDYPLDFALLGKVLGLKG